MVLPFKYNVINRVSQKIIRFKNSQIPFFLRSDVIDACDHERNKISAKVPQCKLYYRYSLGNRRMFLQKTIPSTEIPGANVTEAFVSTWTKFSVLLIGVFPPLKVVERNVMRALFCWDQSLCVLNSGIACVAVSQSKGFTGPLVLYII